VSDHTQLHLDKEGLAVIRNIKVGGAHPTLHIALLWPRRSAPACSPCLHIRCMLHCLMYALLVDNDGTH
jgi:hypothetical protein